MIFNPNPGATARKDLHDPETTKTWLGCRGKILFGTRGAACVEYSKMLKVFGWKLLICHNLQICVTSMSLSNMLAKSVSVLFPLT